MEATVFENFLIYRHPEEHELPEENDAEDGDGQEPKIKMKNVLNKGAKPGDDNNDDGLQSFELRKSNA